VIGSGQVRGETLRGAGEIRQTVGIMIVLFGLANCDTCRKARAWLDEVGAAHRFVDLRADGLTAEALDRWIDALGWQALLNRRSATWRKLDETMRATLDAEQARSLMLERPTLIKRPVWDLDGRIALGFDVDVQAAVRRLQEAA